MKKIRFLLLLMLLPLAASAQWDDAAYKSIEQSISTPVFKNKSYNIKKYGADPSATAADNQAAINKAIADCNSKGGGRVIVPPGEFTTGAITLLSNVNLVVEKGARLLFAFDPSLYPIVRTRWEGVDCYNLQPCIYAYKATNIAITGEGEIDGGGSNETWWKWCGAPHFGWTEGTVSQRNGGRARLLKYCQDDVPVEQRRFGPEDGMRPQLVNIFECEKVLIEGVSLLRSPFWVIHPCLTKNLTVRNVRVDNDGPNGDGCDPESCDGVLIEGCTFNTGDDCIAVKSGRNNDGRLYNLPTQNIIIRKCVMANGHGGVVIGSEITGGCRNLFAEDCDMDSPELERVIRIKTNTCRGGLIENIYARNIRVGQCKEAVLKINLDYDHQEIGKRGFLPTVRNINLSDITCKKSKYGVCIIALSESVNVYDINLSSCHFDGVADGNFRTGLVRDINFNNVYINGKLCPASSLDDANQPIDRERVVSRNNPHITAPDSLASLTVGNGHFATTVDITGLQGFPAYYANGVPLCSMSDWGWHSFPNTEGLTHDETTREMNLHRRPSVYAVEYKTDGRNKQATEYFRVNPHRLNLGEVGLVFLGKNGKPLGIDSITDINQTLKLYDGFIESKYKVGGYPFDVATAVLPSADRLFAYIDSKMLNTGRAYITITFPYPTGKHSDDAATLTPTDNGSLKVIDQGDGYAVVERTIGSTTYYAVVQWEGNAKFSLDAASLQATLMPESDPLSIAVHYTPDRPKGIPARFEYDQARKATLKWWPRYWNNGAIVDFGLCTDSRAPELERRVVLSQYLTKINCDNTTPAQETGLTYNSWFGRPHLEMTWWHTVDFALWNQLATLERMLEWYDNVAYPEAVKIAGRQGFKGARWMKMTDPQAGEAPSNTGSFLIWQQPHYIYMAEEVYRAKPTAETLEKYGKYVDATADFMADFADAWAGSEGDITLRGATAMQESMSKDFSYAHPFEQAYWLYGLQTAQKWRERRGMDRDPKYDDIINRLAPLAEKDGIYVAGLPVADLSAKRGGKRAKDFNPYDTPDMKGKTKISAEDFALKSRSDHPAVLGACGLLPESRLYDKDTMRNTYRWVTDNWNWPTTWGWDYGMMAMAAARLGMPDEAVNALLTDKGKNTYLPNGHNFQEPKRLRLYLPGNGALLTAVAMMCAGWDGTEGTNPGFPADGTWNVRWEGLRPMQ